MKTGYTVCSHGTDTASHCLLCCGKFEDCPQCEAIFKKKIQTVEVEPTLDFIRAKKAREMAAVPVGALCYKITKLSKHDPDEFTNVPIGITGCGYVRVQTQGLISFEKIKKEEDWESLGEYAGQYYECQTKAKPRIGSPLWVSGGPGNMVRTSPVQGYYVHEDPDGHAEHPDKLVLPHQMREKLLKGDPVKFPELEAGDIIMCTLNSFYHLRALPDHQYLGDLPTKPELLQTA